MTYTFRDDQIGTFFGLSTAPLSKIREFKDYTNLIMIHWNRSDEVAKLEIDERLFMLKPQQVATSTYLQHVSFPSNNPAITNFAFNREFYCIQDNDFEVSCNGILFLGAQEPPVITLKHDEVNKYELLLQVFIDEFQTQDNIQGEMLLMLLKRLIIKTTRLAKQQLMPEEFNTHQVDIIRNFNVLVDQHYMEKRQVSDYADMLNKSPKTLANLFASYNHKSPLRVIQERIVLEGKRKLLYSTKSVKEIAYDLGYTDTGQFYKLFKRLTGQTPNAFKSSKKEKST